MSDARPPTDVSSFADARSAPTTEEAGELLLDKTPSTAPGSGPEQAPTQAGPERRSRWPVLVSAGVYLALSVALWWHVWSAAHPTSTATCGCGDASQFLWFVEWPAYAIAHGHSLFFSTAVLTPHGFNLLAATSVLAIGVPLAPVTWVFGPVASVDVAATLIPALSALSMCWLVRRWVAWTPAAFVAGLLYGFSPFVITGLAAGWLTPLLIVPPLVVGCLDELLVRQRRRPGPVGVALGLLLVVQFFAGTETLVILGISAGLGVALVVVIAAVRYPDELRRRAPHALRGLGAAVVVAVILLAYPTWFALAGPAHLSGLIWPTVVPGTYGVAVPAFWRLSPGPLSPDPGRFGGYQGPDLPQAWYLGGSLLVVAAAGAVAWCRDRRLWLFGAMAVVTLALGLGSVDGVNGFWVPWRVLAHVPVVRNVVPDRFVSMALLGLAVMLGIVVDRARQAVGRWLTGRRSGARRLAGWARFGVPALASGAGLAVAVIALLPLVTSYAGTLPLTTQSVVLPQWFADVAPHLPPGQVVLAYPPPFSAVQSSVAWQAVDRLSFAMPSGFGPQAVPSRAGAERAGFEVLSSSAFSFGSPGAPTVADVAAVRRALVGWGVTMVVVPDQPELPAYDQGGHTASMVGLMTEVLGRAPAYQDRAWVWSGVRRGLRGGGRPSVVVAPGAFRSCAGPADYPSGPPGAVPDCLLAGTTGAG